MRDKTNTIFYDIRIVFEYAAVVCLLLYLNQKASADPGPFPSWSRVPECA